MAGRCRCFTCTKALCEAEPFVGGGQLAVFGDPRMMVMFLCETCGNKRCPHAADHRLACSGSNAPGQPGSLYEIASGPGSEAPGRQKTTPGGQGND